ncbi:MAG TPA: hypothetical protein VE398_14575 [Acidobacteriota bacterium]|nr:hypothetical protein [Acidobacteriota bacterium]
MTDRMILETEAGSILSDAERSIIESAGAFQSKGLALKRWWAEADVKNTYTQRFDTMRTYRRFDHSYGFFGEAPVDNGTMPVMGVVDEVFFDRPKSASEGQSAGALAMKEQIREFVLRYFLRISDYRQPERIADSAATPVPAYLKLLSWRTEPEIHRSGMEFSQHFYKAKSTGRIGRFPNESSNAVVDLREVGAKYEWVLMHLRIYDFVLSLKPFGLDGPQFMLPLKEESYLLMSPEYITINDKGGNGVIGEYGFGYSFIKNPERGPFAYGPGEFEAAFQTINFSVLESGETRVRMVFVSNRPDKIVNVPLDPIAWGFDIADRASFGWTSAVINPIKKAWEAVSKPIVDDRDPVLTTVRLANLLTLGQAGKQLDITPDQLNKGFLVRHTLQHYGTVQGSLRTWRQIPDWRAKDLPDWVANGASA